MGSASKRIVLSGYYGFQNSGDEAVLQSILIALEDEGKKAGVHLEPIVLSVNPEWTERTYGIKAVHRMKLPAVWSALRHSNGLISGGGSLLQDATGRMTIPYYLGILRMAQWLRKPTFIYSQGVGPVNRNIFFAPIRSTFDRCEYVSVRDRESKALLERMGLSRQAEVVPDPVMGLKLRSGDRPVSGGERPVIGVSVRYWNENRSELQALAESLKLIRSEREVELRFLPFHLPTDTDASREVIRRMGLSDESQGRSIRVIEGAEHPQDMLAQVDACDLLIGMRLHSLIYAAARYVPMIGISYDPKIDQFLQPLDHRAAATTEQFDAERVAREAKRLLEGGRAWAEARHGLIDRLKAEAQRPAQQIASYFHHREKVNEG